jgi:hypothetical protein
MDKMQVLQNLTFSITTQHYNPDGPTPGVGQDKSYVNNLHTAEELKDNTVSFESS